MVKIDYTTAIKYMADIPLVSFAIPTYNSGATLEKTLRSIKKQTYPKSKIEILVIDGGSKDKTLQIAAKYNCRVIINSRTQLIYGKHLGFLKAKGRYLISQDSDEVLKSPDSLRKRVATFQKDRKVRVVMASGLVTPQNYPAINHYINNFGDPFSFFVHRLSHNPKFYAKKLTQIGKLVHQDKDAYIIRLPQNIYLPIIEATAAGGTIDLKYCLRTFPALKNKPELTTHIFYLLNNKGSLLGVTKNDPIIHYSVGSFKKYLGKISSKVKNNIFQTTMGRGGFWGREKFNTDKYRKYLFIPYSFSLILPFLESLYFTISRKKLIFLIHTFLCVYTSVVIIYFYALKVFGYQPKVIGYGW